MANGLRIHGGRDWMAEKNGLSKSWKTWRKLHIGLNPESGHIVTSSLTTEHVGDPGALPELLAQVADFVCCFIGDGAYDSAPAAAMIRDVFGPDVELVIPPPGKAVPGDCAIRNVHIQMNADHGRMAWQKTTGYGQRSRVEAQIDRYKQVIGPALRGRNMESQKLETVIAVNALNRMIDLGRAAYERVI
ncbi:transposase [Palleronia caenipelagi]|uniref:transposase n=1 Tax=Palleronia caenipelagi TaxID=2489174 RepID=UPI001FEB7795|nr:transposase [Palleronia caenipelagi]